jgi:hypothetical protein
VNIALNESCGASSSSGTEKISIIPNPAPGEFTLRVETDYSINNLIIHIVDMKGSLVSEFLNRKRLEKLILVCLFIDFPGVSTSWLFT